ncbi:myotubularin-related protein 2 [Reticulomyxa filosa]|uniref:Myotubularin-related protein 2 n=1 Tax=Reticulomyxa filosa TaxID=46433 RepID=X6MA23_RETFI|nr:myotubularin-related protein 2 [Reticulomyxa filosa]|eukprot:ETO10496.1 myotubularin-related protein 2 [Reticulomyxa filosa]
MDARPKINAQLNKAKGAGFENAAFYKNIRIEFLNIHNIHVMKKSRQALAKIIHTPKHKDKDWLAQLGNTEWLSHVRSLLKGTLRIVNVIHHQRCSVLCHCSDGWDRTSQLCCLAQLCLDPYFRTTKGFIVLIEKDWLSFGHQFDKRIGHRTHDNTSDSERSPIFEQFIDCVWQLTQQFPSHFEFSQHFLITLLNHVYSCRFGTFLGDSAKQRDDLKLSKFTLSLWTFLQNCHASESFVNVFYDSHGTRNDILFPKYHSKIIRFWNNYYLMHCPEHIMNAKPEFLDTNIYEQKFLQLQKELQRIKRKYRAKSDAPVVEVDID